MKVKLLSEGAKVPSRADEGAAGYDLYAPCDFTVNPGRSVMPLDIQIELNPGTEGQIRPRSGFSLKGMEGVVSASETETKRFNVNVLLGTIDSSYRGNVGVILQSFETQPFFIKAGTKVAQMVISKHETASFEVADTLSETERGSEGFGHTGSM